MKIGMATLVIAGLASAAVAAPSFTVDEIIPGEGHEGDCFLRLWREDAKSVDDSGPPSILEDGGGMAYVKIDGKVVILKSVKHDYTQTHIAETYADAQKTVRVEHSVRIVRIDPDDDGDMRHLKGTMKVDYRGQSHTIKVGGLDFCYSG